LAVLVVGGSGRGAGKTAVGCALIAAMPELRWAAVKVSPHAHGSGESIREETDASSRKDTGLYLAGGARRAFLVTADSDPMADELIQAARERAAECDALLVESNRDLSSIAWEREPMVLLAVMDGTWAKLSLPDTVARADAFVLTGGALSQELAGELLQGESRKPVFRLPEGMWCSGELLDFVRAKLCSHAK
jgi:hypothetical protein